MSNYVKSKALEYSARYHRIAERLFATGRVSLADRSTLAFCQTMIGFAIAIREVPADTLPPEYVERVDLALAVADLSGAVEARIAVASWN
jgi:hypothetical protein